MKNSFRKIFAIAAVVSVMIAACQKDEPGGTTTTDRDKFLGTWKVIAKDSQGQYNYQMTITASNSGADQILIDNFDAHPGTKAIASISGNNISIGPQTLSGDQVNGSGTYSNGTITLHYIVEDGITTEDVTATATK